MTDLVIMERGSDAYLGSECKNDIPVMPQPTTRGGLRVYKIVVLGEGGVGKSAVTLQFVSHSFLNDHDPTIEDSYQQQAVIDGEAALLDILDTAGQVEFTAMRDQYMRCGEGFMICYSVTDRHSFQEVLEYRKLISRVRANEDIPLVLVGNKFDFCCAAAGIDGRRESFGESVGMPILRDVRGPSPVHRRFVLFPGQANTHERKISVCPAQAQSVVETAFHLGLHI